MHVEDFDRAIELLEQQIVDMKRARNALLPLLRLPSDVVIRIVKLLRGWDPRFEHTSSLSAWRNADIRIDKGGRRRAENDPATDKGPALIDDLLDVSEQSQSPTGLHWDTHRGWSSIFRPCSHFRALQQSPQGKQLWSYIHVDMDEMMILHYIRRCQPHSLTLDCGNDNTTSHLGNNKQNRIAQLLPYASAARLIYDHEHGPLISQALRRGGSVLQELQLLDRLRMVSCDRPPVYRINATFLGGLANHLHTLYIAGALIEESFPELPALRRLYLNEGHIKKSIFTLIRFIATFPHLDTLSISHVGVETSDEAPEYSSAELGTPMPWLESLRLIGDTEIIHQLLRFLPKPSLELILVVHSTDEPWLHLSAASTRQDDAQGQIYEYVVAFWTAASGESTLHRGGDVTLMKRTLGLMLECQSSSPPYARLEYSVDVSSIFSGEQHPLLNAINTVSLLWVEDHRVQEDAIVTLFTLPMPNIRHIILDTEGSTTETDVARLETWLRTRAQSGHPVKSVEFRRWPDHLAPAIFRLESLCAISWKSSKQYKISKQLANLNPEARRLQSLKKYMRKPLYEDEER